LAKKKDRGEHAEEEEESGIQECTKPLQESGLSEVTGLQRNGGGVGQPGPGILIAGKKKYRNGPGEGGEKSYKSLLFFRERKTHGKENRAS